VNVPREILKTASRHIGNVIEAAPAFQNGLITVEEYLSILDLAIEWCKFARRIGGQVYGSSEDL